MDRAALEAEIGKPLDQLMFPEARHWLTQFYQRRVEAKGEPSAVDRHRSRLPEGVDGFELDYLSRAHADGAVLDFTLFNGEHVSGRVVGFSPYFITLRLANDDELTLQKLAIAYYRRPA